MRDAATRKFSCERSFSIPTAKVSPLESFDVYGTVQLTEDNEDYENISDNNDTSSMPTDQRNCEDDEGHFNLSQEFMQRSSALFLLGLKEKF